jgi:excinuclease ABC subunit C
MVAARALLPTGPGVYRFRDERGRALYLGRAVNLRRRVASYWGDLRDRPRLRSMVRRIASIEAVLCESEHEAAWLERNVLEHSKPPWNRMLGGLETPVFIQLTAAARAPGLKVVFRPGSEPTFGPYLSGTKTRVAVAALHRVYPLAYTGAALSPSERDMAVKLRVSQDDRLSIVDALTAVLGRQPHAVDEARRRMIALRDAAAAELAFERAGRIQDELAALDWITSPQRVTVQDVYDLVFHGWAAGLLVRFEVSSGRLVGWRAQPCTRDRADAKLAATPPQWRAFAQVNAEIAAGLQA